MSKLKFGDTTVADCAEKLADPKLLAQAKEYLQANCPSWCRPVQLRTFTDEEISTAVKAVERG